MGIFSPFKYSKFYGKFYFRYLETGWGILGYTIVLYLMSWYHQVGKFYCLNLPEALKLFDDFQFYCSSVMGKNNLSLVIVFVANIFSKMDTIVEHSLTKNSYQKKLLFIYILFLENTDRLISKMLPIYFLISFDSPVHYLYFWVG